MFACCGRPAAEAPPQQTAAAELMVPRGVYLAPRGRPHCADSGVRTAPDMGALT
jgi:hypothetical protein